MALPSWAKDTVTRLRAGTIDRRGSTEADWSHPSELEILGCSVQPASTSLSQDGRVLGVSEGETLYMPPGSDVKAGDRIRWAGNVYTITGEPRAWTSPTGRVSSLQAPLERWKG